MQENRRKKIRILCIDGGGIRGIIPAVVVAELEKHIGDYIADKKWRILESKNLGQEELQTSKVQLEKEKETVRIADYVDFLAGTSTGGILTCFYTAPSTSKYSAKKAIELYELEGKTIFKRHPYSKILHWFYNEIYSSKGLERILKEKFGEDKLSETKKPILITAYDLTQRKAVLFNTWKAQDLDHRNFYIKDVARATSAAPTYFEAANIQSCTGIEATLIDGGIYANDPTLCAYVEARKFLKNSKGTPAELKDMYIVSIGTGKSERVKRYEYKRVRNWGVLSWAAPIINIMMSASAEVVNYQMEKLVEAAGLKNDAELDYIKIEPELCNASEQMDNVDKDNIQRLKNAAFNYVKDESETLRKIAQNLVKLGE